MRLSQRVVLLLQLPEQPCVLDGDDGLVGEGLEERDLHVGERPGLAAPHDDDADGSALPQHGDEETASPTERAGKGLRLKLRIELEVWYLHNRAVENCPPWSVCPGWAPREYAPHLLKGFGGVVVLGDRMDQLAVELIEPAEEAVAQSRGAPDNRVKHRPHISRRAADHAQDFACRRLPLERLDDLRMRPRKRLVLLLQLVEQSHVLDRDHRLAGEGLEKVDLVLGKRYRLCAADPDMPDRGPIEDHRHL